MVLTHDDVSRKVMIIHELRYILCIKTVEFHSPTVLVENIIKTVGESFRKRMMALLIALILALTRLVASKAVFAHYMVYPPLPPPNDEILNLTTL
jgi:hypothetical protein